MLNPTSSLETCQQVQNTTTSQHVTYHLGRIHSRQHPTPKKEQQRWPQFLSPFTKLRQMKSSWSLASSFMSTSTTCSSSSSSEQPEPESEHTPSTITTCTIVSNIDPEPPVYDDPCHPWSSSHIQSGIQSDEDEDEEHLPPYECTVSRAGQVHVKREREDENTLSKKRSWRNLYVVVWGTSIRAYKKQPTNPETERPVWSFSMQHAEAGMATDYRKYPDVVRVRIRHGPQFLIRCSTYMSAVLWIDAIQASANVCEDLDTRCMPEFSFGRRLRRSRPHRRSPTNTPTSR